MNPPIMSQGEGAVVKLREAMAGTVNRLSLETVGRIRRAAELRDVDVQTFVAQGARAGLQPRRA